MILHDLLAKTAEILVSPLEVPKGEWRTDLHFFDFVMLLPDSWNQIAGCSG